MATIGLDKLYFAPITLSANGYESYGTPVQLAKAISASLTVELAEGELYADDALSEKVSEFKSGKLSLGVDDIGIQAARILTGATVDQNGVLVSSTEDTPMPVAIGFRAKKSDGTYRYYWLYKVLFSVPGAELNTKGDSISFSTPKIEGTIMRRNKPDIKGRHLWKVEVDEGTDAAVEMLQQSSSGVLSLLRQANSNLIQIDKGDIASVIEHWYDAVYEPSYHISIYASSTRIDVGESITLTVDRSADAVQYEWYEVTDDAENLMASTGSNSFTTEPITTAGTHYYYCKIQRMDMNTIATDPISVRVADSMSEG